MQAKSPKKMEEKKAEAEGMFKRALIVSRGKHSAEATTNCMYVNVLYFNRFRPPLPLLTKYYCSLSHLYSNLCDRFNSNGRLTSSSSSLPFLLPFHLPFLFLVSPSPLSFLPPLSSRYSSFLSSHGRGGEAKKKLDHARKLDPKNSCVLQLDA